MDKLFEKILEGTIFVKDALAQRTIILPPQPPGRSVVLPPQPPASRKTLGEILNDLIDWSVGLGLVVAVLLIIWAAYLLMFSGGNPESVEKGKKTIYYVVAGLAVLLLARGIIYIIRQLIGV